MKMGGLFSIHLSLDSVSKVKVKYISNEIDTIKNGIDKYDKECIM